MLKIQRGKVSVNLRQYLFFAVIALPFLFPNNLARLYSLSRIITLWEYMSVALMLLLFALNRRSLRLPFLFFFLEYLLLIAVTIARSGNMSVIFHSLTVLAVCLTVGVVLYRPSMEKAFLLAVRDITALFFLLDLIYSILYPKGLSSESGIMLFLYGNVNSTIRHVFAGICCSLLLDVKRQSLSILTLFFFLGMLFLSMNIYIMATAMIALAFVALWTLLKKQLRPRMWRLILIAFAVIVFVELTVVVFYSNETLIRWITSLFSKDADFSNRLILWRRTLLSVARSPILGQGLQSADVIQEAAGNAYGAHNYYLDLLYQRGATGLALYVLILLYPLLRRGRKKETSKMQYMLAGFALALDFYCLGEPVFNQEHLLLPILYAFCLETERVATSGPLVDA